MKPAMTPRQSKLLRHHRSKDLDRGRSSDFAFIPPQKIAARCLEKELNSDEINVPSPIVDSSPQEKEIDSSSCVSGDLLEVSAPELDVRSPQSVSSVAKQGEGVAGVVNPEVGEGGKEDRPVDLEMDDSSRKILDNLHEIVFAILENGHGVKGGGRGELQGLFRRRKVQIVVSSFLLAIGVVLLALVFMESSDFTLSPELTPT